MLALADGAGRRLALAGPATLAYGNGALDIRDFALRVNSGRLSVSGRAGPTLDLHATAAGLPLAALDIFSPGLGLAGGADGEATIGGAPDNPTGEWRVRLKQLSAPQMRSAFAPPLDVAGSGRLGGGRTSLDLTVTTKTAANAAVGSDRNRTTVSLPRAGYVKFNFADGPWTRSVYRRGSGPAVIVIHEIPGPALDLHVERAVG